VWQLGKLRKTFPVALGAGFIHPVQRFLARHKSRRIEKHSPLGIRIWKRVFKSFLYNARIQRGVSDDELEGYRARHRRPVNIDKQKSKTPPGLGWRGFCNAFYER